MTFSLERGQENVNAGGGGGGREFCDVQQHQNKREKENKR